MLLVAIGVSMDTFVTAQKLVCWAGFVRFDFQPRMAKNKRGEVFVSYLPAVSQKALKSMRTQISQWSLWRYAPAKLEAFEARYSTQLQG